MRSNVFLSCWLSGLRHSSTGACRLLDRAKSWCQNGDLCENSCQSILSRATASSVLAPSSVIHGQPSYSPRLTGRSSPTSSTLCWIPVYVSPLRLESLFHSVLWSSCPQACWSSKPSALGGFHLLMPDPQPQEPKMGLRTFTFAREPLQYNYFAVFGSPTREVTKVSL